VLLPGVPAEISATGGKDDDDPNDQRTGCAYFFGSGQGKLSRAQGVA